MIDDNVTYIRYRLKDYIVIIDSKRDVINLKCIKVILAGIILLLISLFFMGICIIDAKNGGPQELTLFLFVIGIVVSVVGLFFVKNDGVDN